MFGTGDQRDANGAKIIDDFRDVIIMGAGFDISLMAHIWRGLGVEFQPMRTQQRSSIFPAHLWDRLTIKYVLKPTGPRICRCTSEFNGVDTQTLMFSSRLASKEFGDDEFAFLANKDSADEAKRFLAPRPAVGQCAMGLNNCQHIYNVAILSALNPTGTRLGFLEHLCKNLKKSETPYSTQRVPSCDAQQLAEFGGTEPVCAVVPDRTVAKALAGYLPGSRVEKYSWTSLKPAKRVGLTKTKKAQQSEFSESKKRKRWMDKQIKRVNRGKPIDLVKLSEVERACGHQSTLIKLKQTIAAQTNVPPHLLLP